MKNPSEFHPNEPGKMNILTLTTFHLIKVWVTEKYILNLSPSSLEANENGKRNDSITDSTDERILLHFNETSFMEFFNII